MNITVKNESNINIKKSFVKVSKGSTGLAFFTSDLYFLYCTSFCPMRDIFD